MMFWEYVASVVVLYLIFSPSKYDPAIRLKEWLESKRKK